VYDAYTAPVLEFFKERGLLTTLDGTKTPEEVEADIRATLA
jgi:adenylate kinase family enzyme